MNEIKFNEVEISKINLKPGDVLSVKLCGEEFDEDHLQDLNNAMQQRFPDNKIMIFLLPPEHDIKMEIIAAETKDCSQPTSYCNDCSCGKKEMFESSEEVENQEAAVSIRELEELEQNTDKSIEDLIEELSQGEDE